MPMYICPISWCIPRVPVITNEGITYDFVSIARNLLRVNTNNNPNFNSSLDPTTDRPIDTLIYNHAAKELNDTLMDEVLPLNHEEKTEIALLYTQLVCRYPALRIYGIHTLEGVQALIGTLMPAIQIEPQRAVIVESLWDAACNGHLPVVTALLAAGAAVNQTNANGATPLFISAQKGHLPVVTALLAAGAAINQTNANGATPLHIAAQNGHLPVVTVLLDAGAAINQAVLGGATPLYIAAQKGPLPVVMALLNAGAAINQAMANGATPLLISAQKGHLPVVTALLAAGAAINQTNANGATPLHIAAQNGHLPVVTVLLDAGAAINQAVPGGSTPLYIAAQNGHLLVVTALLDAGAAINQAMADGATPLHTAVLFNHFEVVHALLNHQHAVVPHPRMPIATRHRYPAFVKVLLSNEAVRDYYLTQITIKPELMRDAFTQNPVFFTELATYRNEIWARLRGPAHFNLAPDAHKALLKAILNSGQVPDKTQRHPLHALFSAPEPTGWRSFFSRTENIILNDIQAYTDATYPEPTLSIY